MHVQSFTVPPPPVLQNNEHNSMMTWMSKSLVAPLAQHRAALNSLTQWVEMQENITGKYTHRKRLPRGKTVLKQLFAGQMGLTYLAMAVMGYTCGAPLDLHTGWNTATRTGIRILNFQLQDKKYHRNFCLKIIILEGNFAILYHMKDRLTKIWHCLFEV